MLKTNLKNHLQPKRLVGICYFDKRFCFHVQYWERGGGRRDIRGEVFIFRSQEHGVGEGEGGFNFFKSHSV